MNRQDIIRLASEVGFNTEHQATNNLLVIFAHLIERQLTTEGWRHCVVCHRTSSVCSILEELRKGMESKQ
ncbi:MAG: hypothetical protein ACO25M_00165 [Limnohabitans sp.]|jgi:hypothetical protein